MNATIGFKLIIFFNLMTNSIVLCNFCVTLLYELFFAHSKTKNFKEVSFVQASRINQVDRASAAIFLNAPSHLRVSITRQKKKLDSLASIIMIFFSQSLIRILGFFSLSIAYIPYYGLFVTRTISVNKKKTYFVNLFLLTQFNILLTARVSLDNVLNDFEGMFCTFCGGETPCPKYSDHVAQGISHSQPHKSPTVLPTEPEVKRVLPKELMEDKYDALVHEEFVDLTLCVIIGEILLLGYSWWRHHNRR